MNGTSPSPNVPARGNQLFVLWILWAALCGGMVMYQFKLGGGILHGANADSSGHAGVLAAVVIQIAFATFLRWVVLPRVTDPRRMLVILILGLALSETAELFGIFILPPAMPQAKMEVFYFSLLSALQFIPIWA